MKEYLSQNQDERIMDLILQETQEASYIEQSIHQGSTNEDYFECMNDYQDGTMSVW